MDIVHIPKKAKGQFRLIYVPNETEKATYRALLPGLQRTAMRLCNKAVVHGFMPSRSPVTNAIAHLGFRLTASFDLSEFFDTVGVMHLAGKMGEDLISRVLIDGAPRQGLPTSPLVSNIAATDMDAAIVAWVKASGHDIVYTRYADDLTFSFHHFHVYEALRLNVPLLVERAGFVVNRRKTRLQDSNYGRRIITGVAVGTFDYRVPRAIRRKIRAAKHWRYDRSLAGLLEWSKLRLPHKPIAHTLAVLKGIWDIKRGRMAITNHAAMHQWQSDLAHVKTLTTRDHIAAYMRSAFKGQVFTKDEVKKVDAIVEATKPSGAARVNPSLTRKPEM